jgi:hypothetical protein
MKTTAIVIKRYIKLLALLKDSNQQRVLLNRAPDSVIKAICDAALNVLQSDSVQIKPKTKRTFVKHRLLFSKLVNKQIPIVNKRKALTQKGGLAILPVILSTVLGSLGSLFFK